MTDATEARDGAGAPGPDIRITGGNPSAEEVAAVTAVLSAALEELAGEHRRRSDGAPTAWARSQRSLRAPLIRGDWARSVR